MGDGHDAAAGGGGAAVAHATDVCAEHVGQGGHRGGHGGSLFEDVALDVAKGSSLRGSWHGDRSAVHVHLPITNLVEPCPGERVVLAGRDGIWDGEGEFVSPEAKRIRTHVAWVGGGAAPLNGLDDFEDRVFGRRSVGRQRDLA